jgi:hypothetical protein
VKPLRVALMVKGTPAAFRRDDRNMGYWSYPVDGFTWEHFSLLDNQQVDTDDLRDAGFDLVVHEDCGRPVTYIGDAIPVVYLAIDSTLSDAHYRARLQVAQQASLTLVDHDDLGRWPRARRLNYCVNDLVFQPAAYKDCDIAFHCSASGQRGLPGAETRTSLRVFLHEFCQKRGLRYRSGALGLREYAASIAGARVCVNWPRTATNRPHRVFDALACRTCLVTGPLPEVDGDRRESGYHYAEAATFDALADALDCILKMGRDECYAANGYELVRASHTWAVRAGELRSLLAEELGL